MGKYEAHVGAAQALHEFKTHLKADFSNDDGIKRDEGVPDEETGEEPGVFNVRFDAKEKVDENDAVWH